MQTTKNYYNNEKPLFFSSSSSQADHTLYLDFNKKDILQGLFYTTPNESPWIDDLETLSKEFEGKHFGDLTSMKFEDRLVNGFFDLPIFLLMEALEVYRGKAPDHSELKKERAEELICRCFGVYRNEILELLDKNPDFKNSDISNATMAGAGCTICLTDFPELMAESKARQARRLLES